jgi:hypothetical protein
MRRLLRCWIETEIGKPVYAKPGAWAAETCVDRRAATVGYQVSHLQDSRWGLRNIARQPEIPYAGPGIDQRERRMRIAKMLTAALLGLVVTGAAAKADVLDDIKKRGTLIVGVKADYKPFGFRDPSGGIIGIEPDLAGRRRQEARRQAGAVPVVSANRMEFLNQGKIDLMIATMSDKPTAARSCR